MKYKIKERKAKAFKYRDDDLSSWISNWWGHDDIYWANGWFVQYMYSGYYKPYDWKINSWEVETEGEETGNIDYYPLDRYLYVHIHAKKYRKKVA